MFDGLHYRLYLLSRTAANMGELNLGPFSYHVYLAVCPADKQQGEILRRGLNSRRIACYPRYDTIASVQSVIQEGIDRSRKLIVYVTDRYVNDKWCSFESTKINQKLNRFARDVVIVLKDEKFEGLKDKLEYLTEFTPVTVNEAKLNDARFMEELVREITEGILYLSHVLLTLEGKFLIRKE